MSRRYIVTGIILFGGLLLRAPLALAANDSIQVTATVQPTRVVFLDSSDRITKVVGNTASDITPTFMNGRTVLAPTASAAAQYNQMLSSYGSFLPGETYVPVAAKASQLLSMSAAGASAETIALGGVRLRYVRIGLRQMLRRR